LTDERFALAAQHRARHLRRPPAPRTPIPGCTAPGAASAARRVTVRGCMLHRAGAYHRGRGSTVRGNSR